METLRVSRGALPLPIVLSCEHAGAYIPPEYGCLGMPEEHLLTCPDVYDRGAGELFDDLLERLDCWGVKSSLARLVIDLNRYLEQDTVIPLRCGHHQIPGNAALSERERARRIDCYYLPYRDALVGLLKDCEQRHGAAFLFPIHTMASSWLGEDRNMDFALVCNAGCGLAPTLGRKLEARGFAVAVNDPFRLQRDVLRVPHGAACERFNATAVLIETNDRHAGNREIAGALSDSIEEAVRERWPELVRARERAES